MNDWKTYSLKSLTTRITKGTTPSTIGGAFLSNGINFIKSESVSYNGKIDVTTFAFINEETHNKLKRSQLEKNDILYSMAGIYLGKSGFVTDEILPANTNQALAIIKVDNTKAVPKFIHFALQQKSVIEYVNTISGQSAQPNINMEEIGSIEVLLPPLHEQELIVEILSSLDDKIDLLHQNSKTLDQLAEALFRQWFIEDSEANCKPGRIKDICKLPSGFSFKSNSFIEKGIYKIITIKNVQDGYLDLNNTATINIIPSNLPSHCKLKMGDILLSLTGNVGRVCRVTEENLLLNQRVSKVTPLSKEVYEFCLVLFSSNKFRTNLEELARGTAQSNLSPIETLEVEINVPKSEILLQFHNLTKELFEKHLKNNLQIQQLEAVRGSLLPKLMSGAVRVEN